MSLKFHRRLSLSFLLSQSLILGVAQAAPNDLWVALEKTAYAARELNYQGVFVYQNAGLTRSVQITHMNEGGRELARNVILDGRPREVFSEGDDIVIFNSKHDKVIIEKRRGHNLFPAMLPTDLQMLKARYTPKLFGNERIAGRDTQVIDLVPMDQYRYQYRIWADVEFGLLLKMSLLDAQQKPLEQIGFSQINMLNTHNLDWYQPKIEVTKTYVMEDISDVNHLNETLIVANLPPGYKKVDQIKLQVPGKSTVTNQLIFSDGIASVSVFVEPLQKGVRPRIGHKMMGSTNVCAHVIDGYQVVVVGEVPKHTVQQIAQQVTLKK